MICVVVKTSMMSINLAKLRQKLFSGTVNNYVVTVHAVSIDCGTGESID